MSPAPRPFERLLVANRGEIACRVIKTAKRLGLTTIAVFRLPDTIRRKVKCPGEDESNRKSDQQQNQDQSDRPVRESQSRKDDVNDLQDEP